VSRASAAPRRVKLDPWRRTSARARSSRRAASGRRRCCSQTLIPTPHRARREDWTRDPFTLIEENGSFYARGAIDDKAEASIWVDLLIRYKSENYRPRRTLKVLLTCGEETAGAFNGAQWLAQNNRGLIDAAFALNEGGWGELDTSGHRVSLDVEAGEKFPQNYRLEVTNPGGTQLAAGEGECDLSSRSGTDPDQCLRFPGAVQ
jgi:hypothetical protein